MPSKAKTILFVHGIGNKPLERVLKCQWDNALFDFELGERSRLAYWVNRSFYPNPSEGTCQSGDHTDSGNEREVLRVRSVGASSTEAALDAEIEALAKTKQQREFLERVTTEILDSVDAPARSVSVAGIGPKVLPLPSLERMWLTERITRAWLRDVYEFFYVPERREAMRKSVLDRLNVGGGPFVVVGHSQGSMIAYDVLLDVAKTNADVPLFVTVGSPLGLKEVQDQFKRFRKTKQLKVPACVAAWLNFADLLDPVALDKTLGNEFAPKGFIKDKLVWNRDSPRDPHSGTGYLSHDAVKAPIRQAVDTGLFQPVANFVIARDLVRDIEGAGHQRHSVLIQLEGPDTGSFTSLERRRDAIVNWLTKRSGLTEEELDVEHLRRFLGASLTRIEIEALASNFKADGLAVHRLWKNAVKRALITTSIDAVQARPAHLGYRADGRGIRWAVLDSGIVANHPHFAAYGNIENQFDCTQRGPLKDGGTAFDGNGHGTHVAGIIAGAKTLKVGPTEIDFSGMAPAAKLYIYKVLTDAGTGQDSWIIKALDHIAGLNDEAGKAYIHGVNLSLGGGFDPSVFGCGHTPLCEELRRLWNQGVVVVIAAGNEGFAVLNGDHGQIDANMDLSIGDPANLEEAIAVGSVNKSNPHTYGISYFSSRGPTADGRQKPDLVAPGERILSCRHDFVKSAKKPEDLYVEMSGTSMAAPHVSGIVASYLSGRREFIGFPNKVKQILLDNCTDLKRDPMHQGKGLPNLAKMLVNS